jgi:protein SCO1
MSARRLLLWGVLVCALVVLALGAWRARRVPPLPVLGKVPPFALTDQRGQAASLETLRGEAWIASFLFTRCGGVCPRIVDRLQALGAELPGLRRVAITVDPEYDTPEVLASYAVAREVRDPRWLFLTGDAAQVRALVLKGFLLAVGNAEDPQEPILHSSRLVLVDGAGRIRGYYESEEPEAMARLVREVRGL